MNNRTFHRRSRLFASIVLAAIMSWSFSVDSRSQVSPSFGYSAGADTTRFYPLEVGNEWEFALTRKAGDVNPIRRESVVGDTIVGGHRYLILESTELNASNEEVAFETCGVRFIGSRDYETLEGMPNCQGMWIIPEWMNTSIDPYIVEEKSPILIGGQSYDIPYSVMIPFIGSGSGGTMASRRTKYGYGFGTYYIEYEFVWRGTLSESYVAHLEYAQIDGRTYGRKITSNAGGESIDHHIQYSPLEGTAYPNPFADTINLRLSDAPVRHVDYEMFDLLGRSVARGTIATGKQEEIIEAASGPSGIYFIHLIDSAGNTAVKPLIRVRN